MKIVQIIGNKVYWISPWSTWKEFGPIPNGMTFKEAPDDVEEGWVYDNEAFIAPDPSIVLEGLRRSMLMNASNLCKYMIEKGIVVDEKRFSLTEVDQIELLAQLSAVREGAPAVPYHADGELCRMYTATEFVKIAETAMEFIFYQRTYCNHLREYIRNITDISELRAVKYGMELPSKLQKHMNGMLEAAGADINA